MKTYISSMLVTIYWNFTNISQDISGIFLENDFKYQNAHDNEFGGAISANYGGFFTISCLPFDTFRAGMAP